MKSFKSGKRHRRVLKKDFLRRAEKFVEELWHYVIGESKKKSVVVRQGSGLGVKFYQKKLTTVRWSYS